MRKLAAVSLALLLTRPALASGKPKPVPPSELWKQAVPAEAFEPEVVSDVSAFALSPADIAEVGKGIPAPGSPLGGKLAALMRRAYVSGAAPGAGRAGVLRVTTWNLNAAHTDKEVEAVVSAFEDDPEGVRRAMGRRKPLTGKAVSELDTLSETDVFLLQEVPLPTAVRVAGALGWQVFWAPEFIEVGDNAKGRDPEAGWDYAGNAIVSRVALTDFRVLRFGRQADWYYAQKGPRPLGEKLERTAAQVLFAADSGNPHQTRPSAPYGGRLALFARSAAGPWLADIHLEDQVGPQLRRVQMAEVIAHVKKVGETTVFGGDLNTMGSGVGVGEGEDLSTEYSNVRHPGQPPLDRQHGYVPGVGNKFMTAVSVGNLATTLTHDPGSRKGLVARQTLDLAVHVAPYGPAIQDGLKAARNIKAHPKSVAGDLYNGAEVAADFVPFAAPAVKTFDVYKDEKSRHDPTSRFNDDHKSFKDLARELEARPLNPRTGFRFGMGGYRSTWSSGRPMGLVDTVLDWLFVYDPSHATQASGSAVLRDIVTGSKTGSGPEGRLSDHFPLRSEVSLAQ